MLTKCAPAIAHTVRVIQMHPMHPMTLDNDERRELLMRIPIDDLLQNACVCLGNSFTLRFDMRQINGSYIRALQTSD